MSTRPPPWNSVVWTLLGDENDDDDDMIMIDNDDDCDNDDNDWRDGEDPTCKRDMEAPVTE